MEFNQLPLFSVIKKRFAWLTQRQEILSQNIANADSPGYRASDLKPFDFKEIMRREPMQLNMDATRGDHLGGRRRRLRDFSEERAPRPYETSPAGNAVILEEQMMKLNESSVKHSLATKLYQKHLGLLRTAISKPQ